MGVVTALAFLVLLACVLAYVGWPLLAPALEEEGPSGRERRRADLEEEKERLLGAVKDLDLDHRTGKIDDADFERLSARAKLEAAGVLREIDVNEGRKAVAPRAPVGLRGSPFGLPGGLPPSPSGGRSRPPDPPGPGSVGVPPPFALPSGGRSRPPEPPGEALDRAPPAGVLPAAASQASAARPAAPASPAKTDRYCTACGRKAKPDDAFCGRCGAALPIEAVDSS